jgi:hypothetical protein
MNAKKDRSDCMIPVFRGLVAAKGAATAAARRADFQALMPLVEVAVLVIAVREASSALLPKQKQKMP